MWTQKRNVRKKRKEIFREKKLKKKSVHWEEWIKSKLSQLKKSKNWVKQLKIPVLNHKQDKSFKDKNKKKLAWEDVAKEANLLDGT